jgi:hypothetical protein
MSGIFTSEMITSAGCSRKQRHGGASVLSHADRMPVTLEQMRQKLTHAQLIVDD